MKTIKWLWSKWLAIAQKIGNFNGQVLLSIFYVVFLFPLGFIYRLVMDPLKYKDSTIGAQKSSFKSWDHPEEDLENSRRQY